MIVAKTGRPADRRRPGGPLGKWPDVEERLKMWQRQRDDAQHRLNDALLADDERERLIAERRAASDALPQRKVRGDGSRYDRYADGRVVEVSV